MAPVPPVRPGHSRGCGRQHAPAGRHGDGRRRGGRDARRDQRRLRRRRRGLHRGGGAPGRASGAAPLRSCRIRRRSLRRRPDLRGHRDGVGRAGARRQRFMAARTGSSGTRGQARRPRHPAGRRDPRSSGRPARRWRTRERRGPGRQRHDGGAAAAARRWHPAAAGHRAGRRRARCLRRRPRLPTLAGDRLLDSGGAPAGPYRRRARLPANGAGAPPGVRGPGQGRRRGGDGGAS